MFEKKTTRRRAYRRLSADKTFVCVSAGVVSYTIPDTSMSELSDVSYDGKRQDNLLTDGVGRLIDGVVGADDYRQDMGDGKGKSVGVDALNTRNTVQEETVGRSSLVGYYHPRGEITRLSLRVERIHEDRRGSTITQISLSARSRCSFYRRNYNYKTFAPEVLRLHFFPFFFLN